MGADMGMPVYHPHLVPYEGLLIAALAPRLSTLGMQDRLVRHFDVPQVYASPALTYPDPQL